MSSIHETSNGPVPDGDQHLFEMLDRYTQLLHRGDLSACSEFLNAHPELNELVECLDSLDSLAPAVEPAPIEVPESQIPNDEADTLAGSEDLDATGKSPSGEVRQTQLFGKYELHGEVGRGGMGVVYKARQTDLDRIVALKMILSSRLASEEIVRRFYAEAKAAGAIQHSNIVGIHEVGQIAGQHYFAMDYVDGDSLATLLRAGPIDPSRAARLTIAVANAVEHLHAENIIHRDLKPSNILLDAEDNPYVTDFGLAKVFGGDGNHTLTGTIVGTPGYMPPEQAAGKTSQITPLSDVYSLGAILYEMLCGRPPFDESNPLDTLVQVIEGEPTLLTKLNRRVPREMELICLRCLEKDPQKRYASAAALADDLERFLKKEPIEARPSGIVQKLQRWGRREPALVSRLGGMAVAAVVLQINFLLTFVEPKYHWTIMAILALWAIVAFVFQRMLHHEPIAYWARFGWAAADAILMTVLLYRAGVGGLPGAQEPLGPMVIGYPLLITASGLFFRVRLVWFTTFTCLISYAVLVWHLPLEREPPHYPIIYAAVLAILGFIVAYQVYRVRVLGRYYENRR